MNTWSELAETQPLASRIITNSIKKERISHAYLIQGQRGTGKSTIAIMLAKVLFCTNKSGANPCNHCINCKRIDSGNHPDIHWIEPEERSIKKEQIEYLQKEFTYSGMESNEKVYVIKDADTLTVNAANRILKFLEEPNRQTTAIMMTENSQAILPTIRSRCQIIDLQPLNPQAFQNKLVNSGVTYQNAVLISALTNNLNEALQLNEDDWFAQARKLMIQLVEMFSVNPDDVYLFIHKEWLAHFKDRNQQELGFDLVTLAFKDILYAHIGKDDNMVVFQRDNQKIENLVMFYSQEKLLAILNLLLDAKRKLKQNVNPTLVMEQLTVHI